MYKKYPVLEDWYSILSTSKDRQGIEYVSTMEGKKYPFTGEGQDGVGAGCGAAGSPLLPGVGLCLMSPGQWPWFWQHSSLSTEV
jgi:hypothetical protein